MVILNNRYTLLKVINVNGKKTVLNIVLYVQKIVVVIFQRFFLIYLMINIKRMEQLKGSLGNLKNLCMF